MNLNKSQWKEFRFGDLISDIYKAKAINKDDLTVATDNINAIRYITRTGENNGCELLADIRDIDTKIIEKGNAITIGDTTATCFYQEEDFITGDHMVVIRADSWLNPYTALYIVAILTNEQYKYSYGRAYLMDRIKDTIIKLPVDDKDNPDWFFMEKYIKSLHHKPLTTKNKKGKAPDLNLKTWHSFSVGRLFTMLNGKGITQKEIAENAGEFIAVQSGEDNNGVMGKIDLNYCKKMKYTYSEKPCLTVARSGSAGFVSYQNSGCVVGDSAKILLLPDEVASIEHYLFLQTMLTANRFKYTFGRKVTEDKYLNDVIDLPIQHNADGSTFTDSDCKYSDEGFVPDWEFMENYIKSLPYGDRLEG